MRYNTAAIRDLLNEALSDEEVNALCFDHFRDIYDKYFTAGLNRHQKTQILIEQVERRGELDHLLALVREINPAKVTPFAEQTLRLPSAPVGKSRRLALMLAAALVIIVLGGVWLVRNLRSQTMQQLEKVDTCQASPDPVRVAIQPLRDCSDDQMNELRRVLMAAGSTLESITSAEAPLRTWSQPDAYDIVVGGACQAGTVPVSLDLTFALSSIRNPDDLYQPPEIRVSGAIGDVAPAGAALIYFQRGEYNRAGQEIASLPASTKTRELELLRAGTLLFEQRYDDAIEAYRAVTRQQQDWSAAFNNLGVARYNQSLLGTYATAGEDSLTDAIDLAVAQHESEIELLARVNRANVHLHAKNFDKASADCQQAEKLSGQSSLVRVCWLYYYFGISGTETAKAEPVDAKVTEYLSIPQPDDIPRLVVLRGGWYLYKSRSSEARKAYSRFLEQMQFHACLTQDRDFLAGVPGQSSVSTP